MSTHDIEHLGIDHLGLAVSDLEHATELYRDILGLVMTGGEELPERGLEVRFVQAGQDRIELLGATRPDSEISAFLAKRGEGLHHVALRVRDIDAALIALRARGARLIDEVAKPGAHGTRVAFVHPKGACGLLLELVEHPA